MNKLSLTASDWIKMDLQIKIFTKEEIKLYNLDYNDLKQSILFNTLNKINNKNYKFIENFYNFLAYVFQACMSNSLIIKRAITELNLEFEHKVVESCMLNKCLMTASIIDYFAKENKLNALGSVGIELGMSTVKDIEPLKGYIIQKIYLENIFDSIMEYIERNSLDEDIRTLASYFKNSEINKNISSKFLKNLIKGENIDKIKIMDSIMGTEILVLSFALSEKLYKEAVYSLISLDQEYFKDAEVIEKSLMPMYEEIDRKIEESLVKLGYEEKEAKEIAAKLKFSERKLC